MKSNGRIAVAVFIAAAVLSLIVIRPDADYHSNTQLQIDRLVDNDPRQTKAWEVVSAAYQKDHPRCEFKGCTAEGPYECHHIVPVHLDRSKALDPTNLITLCRREPNHHLYVGHQGNFREDNPNVREDCRLGRYPAIGWERYLRHQK